MIIRDKSKKVIEHITQMDDEELDKIIMSSLGNIPDNEKKMIIKDTRTMFRHIRARFKI